LLTCVVLFLDVFEFEVSNIRLIEFFVKFDHKAMTLVEFSIWLFAFWRILERRSGDSIDMVRQTVHCFASIAEQLLCYAIVNSKVN